MPLTDMQRAYLENCNHRWNIKTGATGSGKSWLDYSVTIPKRILATRGEGLIVLMGNTRGTFERNILDPMRELWPNLVGTIGADNTVKIFGKKCYVLGADNKKHVARIQGATIEYAYGDEVTTWSKEVFEMLKSRLRCQHSHFDGTCNPDSPKHWFKAFLDSNADIFQQAYNIDDNPFLPPDAVEQLKREYFGTVYYQRFILGLWYAADGVVYRQFADDPSKYILKDLSGHIPQFATIGVDFGGNGSAHTFICTGFVHGYHEMVVLEEYYRKEIISPDQLEADFVEFVQMCKSKYTIQDASCDSAEQTLIQGLRNALARSRTPLNVMNAEKKPINDRIRALCRLMGTGRFFVMQHCTHLIEALSTAVWDPKHVTEDVRLDNGTINIDSLDALEYSYERRIRELINAR